MKLTLSGGKTVNLYFKHTTEVVRNSIGDFVWEWTQTKDKEGNICHAYVQKTQRVTTCFLEFPSEGYEFVESAKCHVDDVFKKEYGRRLAFRRVLDSVEECINEFEKRSDVYNILLAKHFKLTKADKHMLWHYVLPRKVPYVRKVYKKWMNS